LVTEINPNNGPQSDNILAQIIGFNLGNSSDDIVSITLARIECRTVIYLNDQNLQCLIGMASDPPIGPVIVITESKGEGISTVNFTYNPGLLNQNNINQKKLTNFPVLL